MAGSLDEWPLVLRTGFGTIFATGRWDHDSIVLVAEAINSGREDDWRKVELWARYTDWDAAAAC